MEIYLARAYLDLKSKMSVHREKNPTQPSPATVQRSPGEILYCRPFTSLPW